MGFKPIFIVGRDLDDTWYQLMYAVYHSGREYIKSSGSRAGMKMYALDFVSGFIEYPHTRPLAPRMPDGIGVPPPTTDINIEKYFVEYLMNNQLECNEHYRYSSWICGNFSPYCIERQSMNQIEWIIKHFKEHGLYNEHCYLTVGHPNINTTYDVAYFECPTCRKAYPKHSESKCPVCHAKLTSTEAKRPTTPCLRGIDFRVVDGFLTMHIVYRSWDLFAWPENMGGFTLLNEYVAEHLDEVKPGPLTFSSKSLHCPDDMFGIVKLRIEK